MPKRSSRKRKKDDEPSSDPNRGAYEAVRKLTGDEEEPEKNPHAQALGRLGGLKGGKARAKKLSKKRRAEIARKAARARWRKVRKKRRNP